jgi:hypothetical protein
MVAQILILEDILFIYEPVHKYSKEFPCPACGTWKLRLAELARRSGVLPVHVGQFSVPAGQVSAPACQVHMSSLITRPNLNTLYTPGTPATL